VCVTRSRVWLCPTCRWMCVIRSRVDHRVQQLTSVLVHELKISPERSIKGGRRSARRAVTQLIRLGKSVQVRYVLQVTDRQTDRQTRVYRGTRDRCVYTSCHSAHSPWQVCTGEICTTGNRQTDRQTRVYRGTRDRCVYTSCHSAHSPGQVCTGEICTTGNRQKHNEVVDRWTCLCTNVHKTMQDRTTRSCCRSARLTDTTLWWHQSSDGAICQTFNSRWPRVHGCWTP